MAQGTMKLPPKIRTNVDVICTVSSHKSVNKWVIFAEPYFVCHYTK